MGGTTAHQRNAAVPEDDHLEPGQEIRTVTDFGAT
jgi:hypothetical protein